MKFWWFMLIMDLLLPLTMIIFGSIFKNKSPEKINGIYGYRTGRSMKNKDTWQFAHKYFGKIWYVCGWIMIPITVLLMFRVMGLDDDTVGNRGALVCYIQMIPLFGSIAATEIALAKNFDKEGNRRR